MVRKRILNLNANQYHLNMWGLLRAVVNCILCQRHAEIQNSFFLSQYCILGAG